MSFFYPKREESLKRFGDKAVWDLSAAVANPMVTAVFITTPNDSHTFFIKKALENKKHIFVEKPITSKLREALELEKLVKNSSVKFMVGHNMRRQSAIRKIKEIIDSGKIGKVVNIYANFSKGIAQSMDAKSWRAQLSRHREGPLITVGIHLIDVFHYLLGPVDSVSATIKNITGKTKVPDSNAVLFNFKNGATAFMETDYNIPSENILHIYGTEGTIYLEGGRLSIRIGRDKNMIPSPKKSIKLKKDNDFKEEIDEFFEAIDGKANIETGYIEALNAMIVVESCYRSAKSKRIVSIKNVSKKYFSV